MKTTKLTLCLLALLVTTSVSALQSWPCGGGTNPNDVIAVAEFINGDSILRITGSGPMADYLEEATPVAGPDYAPWHNDAGTFNIVIVESGITHVGDYAFHSLSSANFRKLILPGSLATIGQKFIPNDFAGEIYCSALNPPTVVYNYGEAPFEYFNLATVYVPKGSLEAYQNQTSEVYAQWWNKFENHLQESLDVLVVTTPQDSITDTKVTLHVEYLADATRYDLKLTNLSTMDVTNYEVTYDDKGDPKINQVFAPSNGAPARRKPILLRDTVRRSTESLQIDITNLAPETPYAYSVEAVNVSSTVIMSKEGTFKTAPLDMDTAIDEFTNEEMRKGKNVKILRNGHIFIIRDGEWLDVTGKIVH